MAIIETQTPSPGPLKLRTIYNCIGHVPMKPTLGRIIPLSSWCPRENSGPLICPKS